MPRRSLSRLILALAGLLAVSGCQVGLPGTGARGEEVVTPNAVLVGDIEVTPLDTPAPPLADAGVAPTPSAPAQSGPPPVEPAAEAATPAPQPELAPVVAPTPKSEQQVACEKRKGSWVRGSVGEGRTCIFATKDGGKQCTRESQCDGECLARSGTCSPVKPLLGCNDVLQDNGARVTLCIE